jgi:hypothetical protein
MTGGILAGFDRDAKRIRARYQGILLGKLEPQMDVNERREEIDSKSAGELIHDGQLVSRSYPSVFICAHLRFYFSAGSAVSTQMWVQRRRTGPDPTCPGCGVTFCCRLATFQLVVDLQHFDLSSNGDLLSFSPCRLRV